MITTESKEVKTSDILVTNKAFWHDEGILHPAWRGKMYGFPPFASEEAKDGAPDH